MVKAVDHDVASGLATTGYTVGKDAIIGGLVPAVVSAALTVGIIALVAGTAAFTGGALAVTMGAAAITGVAGFAWGGVVGAAIGGVLGLFSGANRVSAEKSAFNDKLATHALANQGLKRHAMEAAAQHGYQAGIQDGANMVVNKLREAQYAAIQQNMAEAQQKNDIACGKCVSHAAKEQQRREATAAAGIQLS